MSAPGADPSLPPQVAAERRCAPPPMGCGQPLSEPFRDEVNRREYGITGLCQRCQDEVFGALAALAEEADEVCDPPPYGTEHELERLRAWMREQGYVPTESEETP